MASTGEVWKLGHRPALDGVRGIAVLLVVASHAWPGELVSAGPAGVTIFFVLSGFLITALLLEEHARAGRLDLRAFYVRRARRLFPALAVFLAVMLVCGAVTARQLVPVVLYVGNWWPATGASLGGVGHTWSLAVEEQFYLLFPLVAVVALRRSRWLLVAACVLGVFGSFAARVALVGSAGVDRAYYGTDTNAGALLLGCVIALLLHQGPVPVSRPRAAVGVLSLIALLGLVGEGPAGRALIPVAAAFLTAVLLVSVVGDKAPAFLRAGWLRLVGRRAYALYLWHVPVLHLVPTLPGPRWVTLTAGLALSWILTLLSWRYVERPFLQVSTRAPIAALVRPLGRPVPQR